MIDLIHPVSGEHGYFCTKQEKELIDAILVDFKNNHLVVTSSRSARGEFDE